jgi:RNA polymerase sigma-70 factor (ECF subfamily)
VTQAVLALVQALGRAAWPALAIADDRLAFWLERLVPEAAVPPGDPAGLYLAAAVLEAVPGAMKAFDQVLVEAVTPVLVAMRLIEDQAELLQRARIRLVVGETPALLHYAGRGDLATWLRVVTSRIGIDHLRALGRDRRSELELSTVADRRPSAESQLGHAQRRELIGGALRAALTRLSPRARALLQLHHVEGVTIDGLAPTYGVHRATVARWIEAAREDLQRELTAELIRLDVPRDAVPALVAEELSQLDLGLSQL